MCFIFIEQNSVNGGVIFIIGVNDYGFEIFGVIKAMIFKLFYILTDEYDAAIQHWGGNWRMPTKAELEALLSNCTVEWTQVNSVNGRKFTGKGAYASNSVFLPAAGYCYYGNVGGQGYVGIYWSSTPYGSYYAYYLYFDSGYQFVDNFYYRYYGFSVRAVLAE